MSVISALVLLAGYLSALVLGAASRYGELYDRLYGR
jgi:hypothetical protein